MQRNGQDYVGLLETLEPLGRVNSKADGPRWNLRFNYVEGEFIAGNSRVHIRGDYQLPAGFLLENGRGLVPLSSLGTLLPRYLGGPVTFQESSRRLFVGNAAVHFTAEIKKTASDNLVLEFTSPVNPRVDTEASKVRMSFTHEPLAAPSSNTLSFESKIIPSASYEEVNGAAIITVNGSGPLFASFSNDGRTITITPAPQAPPPQTVPGNAGAVVPPSIAAANLRRYFAVVDASHGGDERGAALADQLSEKDVTLSFARLLRQELENRGLSVLVLRDGDVTLSPDQRANLANAAHPAIYISIHAASQGNGVRLYTALLPVGNDGRGPFLDWDTAQSTFLPLSQEVQSSLAAELRKNQISVRTLSAPLRPLNNLIAPAIAVELAPPPEGLAELNSVTYQQSVARSIVTAITTEREKLEAGR